MPVEIRPFDAEDIDFALAQTAREGWDNMAWTFRACLENDPSGCLIAEVDGKRAGMITTVCHERSAWIGNLIVVPDYRRRGLGERLMLHAMDRLEARGVGTVRLKGDPMGIGIYRRLGFTVQFDSLRFHKEPPHRAKRVGAAELGKSDIHSITALDRSCFGDDRSRLLESLLDASLAAYCIRADDQVEGFAMALPSAHGVRFGPCIAKTRAAAEKLLDAVLAGFPNRAVLVGVPSVNPTSVEVFESRGFHRKPSSLRMLHGEAAAESDADTLMAIANGAMG